MLLKRLQASNDNVRYAIDDADVIIKTMHKEEYFLKPETEKVETEIYLSKSADGFQNAKCHIFFLHTVSGVDTTFPFNIEKRKAIQLLRN